MRLAHGLLSAALLAAPAQAQVQAVRALPWEGLTPAPWQTLFEAPDPVPPPPAEAPGPSPLRIRLTADGTLAVVDPRGVVRLRTGLPGRPVRVWRDGGVPVPAPWTGLAFPGGGAAPLFSGDLWTGEDPRRGLAGLLWIQDDGERTLTLVHPATGKVAFLTLPEAVGLDLVFLPTGLAALERSGEGGGPGRVRRWLLPWVALLPALARLVPPATPPRAGTALEPFPREKGW